MVEYYVLKKLATSEDESFQTGDKYEFTGIIDIETNRMNSIFVDEVVKKFGKGWYLTFKRDDAIYFKFFDDKNNL
jgi:hypothetical protein